MRTFGVTSVQLIDLNPVSKSSQTRKKTKRKNSDEDLVMDKKLLNSKRLLKRKGFLTKPKTGKTSRSLTNMRLQNWNKMRLQFYLTLSQNITSYFQFLKISWLRFLSKLWKLLFISMNFWSCQLSFYTFVDL